MPLALNLEAARTKSAYVNSNGWCDLDGADIARDLTAAGYVVLHHRDAGTNAEAVTACGLIVSSNGWCYAGK